MDDRRVADYFVVAGLDPNVQLPLEEFSNEAITKPTSRLDPITDITVINRSLGEKVPKGYECIEQTPTGYPANLNHGSIRCPDMFICYKRGRDKPPLKDLGILYEGKEHVMEGCEVVSTTLEGHPANVNNSNSSRTYITYRRAEKSAPTDTLVVVDICVILGNRNEEPPLTFLKILKNLNKGMLGSDVFLCYKKAMVKNNVLAYKASILDRYPLEDYSDFPLPQSVPMFCLPMGATIECWAADAQHPVASFSTFILTGAGGEKVYGAAVGFYEEYREEDLSDLQMRSLGLKNRQIRQQFSIQKTVHVRKSISLLSHWPFFDAFKKFLSQLYKISITGPHNVPMERHISHFMFDVPYPSPERPRILVQLTHDSLSLCMPEDSPLPQSGASFITLLRNLGPELTMNLLLFVLLESKILLHSLRPTVLTEVAEAVSTMIFPFHWQCPYIPLCPLGLSDVLNAPCPFIVGVDSRYFDLYDPPPDVICVDLDTNRISPPEDKKTLSYKFLPKKPTRVLQESLLRLYDKVSSLNINKVTNDEVSLEMTHFDIDFRRKKRDMQLELSIQEVFLRFTASLLKDYKNFLNPITKQPNLRATDAASLFDMQGFLKSRDKANTKFYSQMMRTQMFFRFIEERSFVSDKDVIFAFFDECTEKVDETRDEPKLIEIDNSQMSERTVFIMPPEPVGLPEGVKYSYNGFPKLKQDLFLTKKKEILSVPSKQLCPNSPLARRTKQEIKSAQKVAQQQVGNPKSWAKCLLSYCYSLWFVVFPSYVQSHPKKMEALKVGMAVMRKMQETKLSTVDELCYRVMMQLAGQYNKPGLAVQVFTMMKKHGVHPNAITYGYYNKVMLEAKWPSPQSKGRLRWLRIRNVIIGVAQFRRTIRRRSLSLYSNSGSEFDQISHTSAESYLGEAASQQKTDVVKSDPVIPIGSEHTSEDSLNKNNGSLEERMSTGGVSDRGYNSMTQEDVKRLSQIVIAVNDNVMSTSPASNEMKSRMDAWNPLNLLVGSNQKPKHHLDKVKKEVHIVDDKIKHHGASHRPRVGSIVKRSVSSVHPNHRDDFEILKDSLLNNSCGLVMLSKVCLEKSSCLPDTDLRLQVEEAKRRRHRSAGENHPKPSRSMSLFASWRPPRIAAGQGQDSDDPLKLRLNFSDLIKKEEDDISLASLAPKDSNHTMSESSSSETSNSLVQSTKDNECNSAELSLQLLPENSSLTTIETNSPSPYLPGSVALEEGPVLGTVPEYSSHPLIDHNSTPKSILQTITEQSSQIINDSTSLPINSNISNSGSSSSAEDKTSHTLQSSSTSNGPIDNVAVNRREIRRSVSIPEDRLSNQLTESMIKQSLSETGPMLNSPESNKKTETRSVKQISEDSQSVSSLTETRREKATDFMFKRTHSLKKTNEAFGSFLKYASNASKAAFTKLNELKNTIATPIKNGSLGSLTQSNEELDANDGSSTSGTIRDRLRHGGSQDLLSHSEESDVTDDTDKRMSGLSFESVPSPSFLEDYTKLGDFPRPSNGVIGSSVEQLAEDFIKMEVAMEVEISSCSRCTKCNRLIYDEEIMAGWSAEDSNLNTSCPYCHAKFVPHLQIYLKDWRENRASAGSTEKSYPTKEKLLASTDQQDGLAMSTMGSLVAQGQSSLERGEMPLTFEEAAETIRRRCTSECLTSESGFGSSLDSPTHFFQRSPLSLSIEEETPQGTASSEQPGIRKDFMTRSASSSEPIVLPYLSPLVLRKEVEFVLDHESNMCLVSDTFVEDHPIIFWNLVWFFRRIELPTHLTGFLLTSKAFNANKKDELQSGNKTKSYTSQNILIRPQWDNIRIHDEIGLPMYLAWRAGHKSTVVDALVIESDCFSRPIMWQIVSAIKRNDVLAAVKIVVSARKKINSKKRRFRSMYREILFLSFAECGRENIDHEAFDREYSACFQEKLEQWEIQRLQLDDHPKAANVKWCRKVFAELEV
ncbi:DENN domain-containing protein 4B [Biomphalaria pfeifferi]|uniref:DENN domain-containing protein 4B n=1 Tax=Biomphalaria pfeifferi TaxID=112525 RepID=A0AAD8B6R5_BIOPF|nr:DENN domain-containing protein 4B [Biomphalaria pfeifferi]